MKLVSHNNVCPTFGVDFHGVKLTLPMRFQQGYLAMQYDGTVIAFTKPPKYIGDYWINLHITGGSEPLSIAKVESDMDPGTTLVSINDHRVKKYME